MEMIPGMGGLKDARKQLQEAEERGELRRTEAIIRSMTPEERRDPNVLNASRRRRIARGSGTSLPEVNRLPQAVRRDAADDAPDEPRRGRPEGDGARRWDAASPDA